MKITSIEKDRVSGLWYGFASMRGKNYEWFYGLGGRLIVREQDWLVPRAWMNVEPTEAIKDAVLSAIREAA